MPRFSPHLGFLTQHNILKFGVLFIILLALWIFNKDYLTPLFSGFIVAILTYPIYIRLFNFQNQIIPNWKFAKKSIPAVITISMVFIILFGIINFFARQIIRELPLFINQLIDLIEGLGRSDFVINILQNLEIDTKSVNYVTFDLRKQFNNNLPSINQIISGNFANNWLFNIGQRTIRWLLNFFVYISIFLLAWFNGLVSGPNWVINILKILPLTRDETQLIHQQLRRGIINVIYANLLSGIIHAAVCMSMMLIFDVPNVFIVTTIVFLVGFLPMSPSEIAYAIPLLMIFQQYPIAAIILAIIAELIVLWVNYILTPNLIVASEEENPMLILTSILSGITIFGLMGFIIGPVIMIFVQTLYRIFFILRKEEPKLEEKLVQS